MSGADQSFTLGFDDASLPLLDPVKWRPRLAAKVIDDISTVDTVNIRRIGTGSMLVDATGEPPLVLIGGVEAPRFGRWADNAVVTLFGDGEAIVATGTQLLEIARPKLIALAADEQAIDLAIDALREHLAGAALVSLEPGLALEV